MLAEVGGTEKVKLLMLPRLYRPGDGDIGICFKYAVHDAVKRGDPLVLGKIHDGMKKHCKVKGRNTASILFWCREKWFASSDRHGKKFANRRVEAAYRGASPTN